MYNKRTDGKPVSKAEILDMARDLGMALSECEEIISYREAERMLANDEEACRLTRIFKQKQRELAALYANPDHKEEDIIRLNEEVEKADKEMKANPLIASYYNAGNAFNNLIYQINQLLKFYSMEPEESSQFTSSTGGCGSCGGCSK